MRLTLLTGVTPKASGVFSAEGAVRPQSIVSVLMMETRFDCGPDHGDIKVQTKEPVPTIRAVPVMPRPHRQAAPLGLVLDTASQTPWHRQIFEQVRRAILERRLAPGQRLPSSRLMAGELDVARGTVLLAMDQLI